MNVESDEEFEKLMQQADDDDEERCQKKKRKKEEKQRQKEAKQQQFIEDHQDFCEVCQQGGEILLCDGCPKAYHRICLDPELEDVPEGEWFCPVCVENGVTGEEEEKPAEPQPAGNMDTCMICSVSGLRSREDLNLREFRLNVEDEDQS